MTWGVSLAGLGHFKLLQFVSTSYAIFLFDEIRYKNSLTQFPERRPRGLQRFSATFNRACSLGTGHGHSNGQQRFFTLAGNGHDYHRVTCTAQLGTLPLIAADAPVWLITTHRPRPQSALCDFQRHPRLRFSRRWCAGPLAGRAPADQWCFRHLP